MHLCPLAQDLTDEKSKVTYALGVTLGEDLKNAGFQKL